MVTSMLDARNEGGPRALFTSCSRDVQLSQARQETRNALRKAGRTTAKTATQGRPKFRRMTRKDCRPSLTTVAKPMA